MLYVVTEDTNSGRDFWKKVMETFFRPDEYIIVDFLKSTTGVDISGNESLDNQIDHVLSYAQKGDALFVAFDNIGTSTRINKKTNKVIAFDSGEFLMNTRQKCRIKNINLYVTSYYCFEEIYLSYIELEKLVKIDSKAPELAEIIKYVRECIDSHIEYYDRNKSEVQYVINIKPDAKKNKEHFADALLFHSTQAIRNGRFTISKKAKKSMMCWILGCKELQEAQGRKYPSEYDCDHCKFKMKNCNTLEKLTDLDNNLLSCNAEESLSGFENRFTVKIN